MSLQLKRKLAYRVYLLTMRLEGMVWLRLRRTIVNVILGRKHANLNIFPDVFIDGMEGLKIGDNVSFNRGCHISAVGGLSIGDYVSIGHGTSILTSEHSFSDAALPIQRQPVICLPVNIGSDVWVGAHVTILAGVSLPDRTIVGAGAVVTKSVEESGHILVGVPAKSLKRLQ